MRLLVTLAASITLAGTAAAEEPTAPPLTLLSIKIGAVRISPKRPSGSPWTTVAQSGSTAAFGKSVCGLAGQAVGVPLPLSSVLCGAVMSGSAEQQRNPTAPNPYVAIKTPRGVTYRTHTAVKSYTVDFDDGFIVPADAIPSTGLELLVVNDTAERADTDDEVIATFRPTRDQLETAAGAAPPTLVLDEHNAGDAGSGLKIPRPKKRIGSTPIPGTSDD